MKLEPTIPNWEIKPTLQEVANLLDDKINYLNKYHCNITTQKSYIERSQYWYCSDYKVSGVSGHTIYFRKN